MSRPKRPHPILAKIAAMRDEIHAGMVIANERLLVLDALEASAGDTPAPVKPRAARKPKGVQLEEPTS